MGEVKRVVSNLLQILDRNQKEARSLVDTMHRLQDYLEKEPKRIIEASLDRLLSRIRAEATKITRGSVLVLVSPQGRVTVGETYSDEDSDPWLRRLKSQDFSVLSLPNFSYFIESLKSQVAEGNWIPVIEFLRANTELPPVYPLASTAKETGQSSKPSTSSEWKLSDWLPALPPYPPLPRGLFRD